MKFEWDENKNEANKIKHGVSFEEAESVFEKLCCKGGMSNSLLIQHGGYPIRSSLRKRSREGATSQQQQFGRFYGAYIALYTSVTTKRGICPTFTTGGYKPQKGGEMTPITYTRQGDYLLPDIALHEPSPEPLTKYGFMRRSYLKQHRPILYSRLLLSERLHRHLLDTQQAANERMETMMAGLIKQNPPPDKATDNLAWAAHMNALHHSAKETILAELIYE